MPRSRHCDQRTASPTSTAQVSRVLQRHPPASVPPQQQPPSTRGANPSWRAHRCDPAGRRTSSPLSARCLSAAAVSARPPRYYEMAAVLLVLCRPSIFLVQPFSAAVNVRGSVLTSILGRTGAPEEQGGG